MTTTWRGAVQRAGVVLVVLAAVAVTLAVAWLVPDRPVLALVLAGVVLVGVAALVQPVTLPLLAMPLIVVGARVGGGGVDLPIATLMLGIAFWPAMLFAPRPLSPTLRRLLWFNAVYQAATLFTLIANPFLANTVDWFHSWLMVAGALIVGWSVGASGAGRAGMQLFVAAVLCVAFLGVVQGLLQYARGDFSALFPSWPFAMHKNFFGTLVSFGALILFARAGWAGLSRGVAVPGFLLCIAALGLSQSRQAIVGLAIGLVVIAVQGRSERRRAWLSVLVGVPAAAFVITLVREQIESGNEYNSFFQRLSWYSETIETWSRAPIFGNGLRYWTTGDHPGAFQPPQVFLEVMATTGVVGLAGFLIMVVGVVLTLWRLPGLTGSLALALVVARLSQAQLDIFWLAPTTAIPFLLAGVCIGVVSREGRQLDAVPRATAAAGAG